jgi:hypothetical protein
MASEALAKHPDLYLYAALLEAEPFLRRDARIATSLPSDTLGVTQDANEAAVARLYPPLSPRSLIA